MKIRLLSLLLTLTMLCGLVCVSAPAALADFSDVTSGDVAESVATLEGMGIVNGYGNGYYYPNNNLTRAEFCKLVVLTLGKGDSVSTAGVRSPFSDVPSTHWANGYINYAYTEGLINGYGNGCFGPDDTVTHGQAVTIMLRMLGYTASDVGTFWPDDFISAAIRLKLSEGVTLSADKALTRGEAAIMLANMFDMQGLSGTDYYKTVCSAVATGVILDNNATDEAGRPGRLYAYVGTALTYYEQKYPIPDALVGRRGTLLLNSTSQLIGFVPSDGKNEVVTINKVESNGITGDDGSKRKIPSDAVIVYEGETYIYGTNYYMLEGKGGARLYYSEAGEVEIVYISTSVAETAVIANSATDFVKSYSLDGDSVHIYKNGALSDISDIAKYDVGVYDEVTGCLLVSDCRVTGYYEDVYPNIIYPETITILGTEFDVLECAQASLSEFAPGDMITVLFAPNGKVARALSTSTLSVDNVGVLDTATTVFTPTSFVGTTGETSTSGATTSVSKETTTTTTTTKDSSTDTTQSSQTTQTTTTQTQATTETPSASTTDSTATDTSSTGSDSSDSSGSSELPSGDAPSGAPPTGIVLLANATTVSSSSTSLTLTLPGGIALTPAFTDSSAASALKGRVVKVTSTGIGKATVANAAENNDYSSSFDVASLSVGSSLLSPDVLVFDKVEDGAVAQIELSDIAIDVVSSRSLSYVGKNNAGKVNLLVLDNVTGDCYEYGELDSYVSTKETTVVDEPINGGQSTSTKVTSTFYALQVINNTGTSDVYTADKLFADGGFGGVAADSDGTVADVCTLTAVTAARSQFDRDDYVTIDGVKVPISEDVQIRNNTTESWALTFEKAMLYTDSFTVYYDKTPETGGKIRIITIE